MPNPIHALTRFRAETHPEHDDPALRGRTYAISFDRVWVASMELAGGSLRGWTITGSDDREGRINVKARSLLGAVDDVEVHITLDPNAQTRVDLTAEARKQRGDLGRNRRRIIRFLHRLDQALDAKPGQLLSHFVFTPAPAHGGPLADPAAESGV